MTQLLTDVRTFALPRTKTLTDWQREGTLTKELAADWLRQMQEIRAFEDRVYDLIRAGTIKGASHLSAGQEAVPVGSIAALTRKDLIASTHRGHGHCGAMGDLMAESEEERQHHWDQMMAELFGKETGYCRGRGGSMHIADVQRGNLGATGIVAGNIPIATGAALAEHLKGTEGVVLCFFGDGAVNTGAFHESLNMGATLLGGLPVVYICENNLYGMSVPFHKRSVPEAGQASNIEDIAVRAAAYNMPGVTVDGQDVLAVRQAVGEAVDRARRGEGPTLIEAKTYRYYGHSISDARAYRTREEEKYWREERDPIDTWARRCIDDGLLTEEEVEQARQQARETIDQAVQFATDSPLPDPKTLLVDIYVDPEPQELERLKAAEEQLRAKVRPVEDEVRAIARKNAAGNPKAVMPRVGKSDQDALEEKHGLRLLPMNQALVEAQAEEMRRDERVIVMGEDIGLYGGAYAATRGLLSEFGPRRVIDTAISEAAVVGAAGGAAMRDLRPIAEIMYIDFITIASNQLVHNISYNRYQFGGKIKVPCVIRTEGGVGRSFAATHSESLESWFVHIPGLYVVMPSTPYDAKGLLKAAIRDENPVLFIEHKAMYSGVMGPVPQEEYLIPLGVADIKRPGDDVTIIAYSRMVHFALEAALDLEEQGISAEVIDPRTLNPLDLDTIAASVRKTGRLVVVSEAYARCGVGEDIIRRVMEYKFENGRTGFSYLDGPPMLCAGKDCPIPMSEPLEDAVVPTKADIVAAARALVGR